MSSSMPHGTQSIMKNTHHPRPGSQSSSSSNLLLSNNFRSSGSNNNHINNNTAPTTSSAGSGNNVNSAGPPDDELSFPYCEDVDKYEKIGKIGQGTFGEVFKARHRRTRKLVALKKVLMENEKEGFPITALREIKILQLLKHENVINLIEICRTASNSPNYKATFYLVFDFCEHDLAGLLSSNVKFSLADRKKIMQQLLNGLYFVHKQKILHRDMKAANILITKTGVLKLADFGLARAVSELRSDAQIRYTNRVVTLWYRPPELLLGARNYGPPIDLWGAGCIMAELWTRSPILQGNTEQTQLNLISQLCGSITPDVWPGVEKLELYHKIELVKNQKRKVKEKLKHYVKDMDALDLLDKLLILDPSKRIDSDNALNHDFFWNDVMPSDLGRVLSVYSNSMYEFTTSRRRTGVPPGGPPPSIPNSMISQNYQPPHHPGHSGHPGPGNNNRPNGGNNPGGQYMDRVF